MPKIELLMKKKLWA